MLAHLLPTGRSVGQNLEKCSNNISRGSFGVMSGRTPNSNRLAKSMRPEEVVISPKSVEACPRSIEHDPVSQKSISPNVVETRPDLLETNPELTTLAPRQDLFQGILCTFGKGWNEFRQGVPKKRPEQFPRGAGRLRRARSCRETSQRVTVALDCIAKVAKRLNHADDPASFNFVRRFCGTD